MYSMQTPGEEKPYSFASGNLAKLRHIPRYLWGMLRSMTTRRDPLLWVIGSNFGLADGAWAFSQAASRLDPAPRIVWQVSTERQRAEAIAAGVAWVDRDEAAGFEAVLHAGVIAVTHGLGDVHRYGQRGAVIVQLWHGAPLKKLHADSPAVTTLGRLGRIPGLSALMRWLYRRGTSSISLFPTGAPCFVESLCSAFALTPNQVRVTGEPRADVLFTASQTERITAARALLAPHLGAHTDARVVLYAPTWRDGEPDPSIPTPAQWQLLEQTCERHNLVLLVRPHPLGVGDYDYSSDRIRLLTSAQQTESMPLLWGIDVLITDYSSMLVDYTATGGAFILLAPDLEHYEATRGLYVDYSWLAAGRWYRNWDEVAARLDGLFGDSDIAAEAQAHTRALAAEFHTHTDGLSAQRVALAARELVSARA